MSNANDKAALKVVGIIAGLAIFGLAIISLVSGMRYDNVAKVANKNISKSDFQIKSDVNTVDFLGPHFKTINGYQVYEDDFVKFYVDNPRLSGKKSDSFFVNFEAKNKKICTQTIRTFNLNDLSNILMPMKNVTIDGESVKVIFQSPGLLRRFYCEKKSDSELYHIKYEFYLP